MAIEYFCAYHSYLETMEQLDDAERGRLFTACLIYSKTGEAPELCGNERFVFPSIRSQMERDRAYYESRAKVNRQNGQKGGRPKKQAVPGKTEKTQSVISKPKKPNESENENENESENEKGSVSPVPPLDVFSSELQSAFSDWLIYKAERREAYKPTGLRNLQSEVRSNAEKYGDQAVAAVIRTSMSCGYRGIVFDRLQERRQQTTQRVRTSVDYENDPEF